MTEKFVRYSPDVEQEEPGFARVGSRVILFDNAGIGGSSGQVPQTIGEMANHTLAFAGARAAQATRISFDTYRRKEHGNPAE